MMRIQKLPLIVELILHSILPIGEDQVRRPPWSAAVRVLFAVCVHVRERVYVIERERDKERERVCVCVPYILMYNFNLTFPSFTASKETILVS